MEVPVNMSTESLGFLIFVLILTIIVIILCSFNAYYFSLIRGDPTKCTTITSGYAYALTIVNVIIAILAFILLIYCIVKMASPLIVKLKMRKTNKRILPEEDQ